MSIFDILTLVCGLSLFLFGMNIMGDSLKRSTGNKLKGFLSKMTSNPLLGFLLGLIVTAVIQSSAATTVMVMGFVSAGTMTLAQSVGVVIGANVGTAVTAWLTGLSGLNDSFASLSSALRWAQPSAWMPLLALAGILLQMVSKKSKNKDLGAVFLGFAVLMVGMSTMSSAVEGLKTSPEFQSILTAFSNPILGLLSGTVLAAIVQSSSAGIGIFQTMTVTGAISFSTAVPVIAGLNLGSCITPFLSSLGAKKNVKRVFIVYLFFNLFGSLLFVGGYFLLDAIIKFGFAESAVNMWDVATLHSIFKLATALILIPFAKPLTALITKLIPDQLEAETVNALDERLLRTPSVAVGQAEDVAHLMAEKSIKAMKLGLQMVFDYDKKTAEIIRDYESEVDIFEDSLGTFLVKLSGCQMQEKENRKITKLLHLIGDFERISDHAVNILESAEEIREKNISFSPEAQRELKNLIAAVDEILSLSEKAFLDDDLDTASHVEPLEQVVDHLKDQIKMNHVLRVQKSECTIEHGFVLSDLLTNFERVSDHCSNIAGCVIEISRFDELNMHQYLGQVKAGGEAFDRDYNLYSEKYAL